MEILSRSLFDCNGATDAVGESLSRRRATSTALHSIGSFGAIIHHFRKEYESRKYFRQQTTIAVPQGFENYSQRLCFLNALLQSIAALPDLVALVEFLKEVQLPFTATKGERVASYTDATNVEAATLFVASLHEAIHQINLGITTSQYRVLLKTFPVPPIQELQNWFDNNKKAVGGVFDGRTTACNGGFRSSIASLSAMQDSNNQEDPYEAFLYIIETILSIIQFHFQDKKPERVGRLTNYVGSHELDKGEVQGLQGRTTGEAAYSNNTRHKEASQDTSLSAQENTCGENRNEDIEYASCHRSDATIAPDGMPSTNKTENGVESDASPYSIRGVCTSTKLSSCVSGLMMEWTQCTKCSTVTICEPLPFSSLQLPVAFDVSSISNSTSLLDCLNQYFDATKLEGVYCNVCSWEATRIRLEREVQTAMSTFKKLIEIQLSPATVSRMHTTECTTDCVNPKTFEGPTSFSYYQTKLIIRRIQIRTLEKVLELSKQLNERFTNELQGVCNIAELLSSKRLSSYKLDEMVKGSSITVAAICTNKTKRCKLLRLPTILCLHLQRNQYIGGQLVKIGRHVDFPQLLNLSQYKLPERTTGINWKTEYTEATQSGVAEQQAEVEFTLKQQLTTGVGLTTASDTTYELHAVIEHIGGSTSGHFLCFRRWDEDNFYFSPSMPSWYYTFYPSLWLPLCSTLHRSEELLIKSYQWRNLPAIVSNLKRHRFVCASDESVCRVPTSAVLNCQAYLLFYQTVDPL